jgi:hypothetical protein
MAWLTQGYDHRWLVFTSPLIIDLVLDGPVEVLPMLGIALGWLAGQRSHLLGLALVMMVAKPQSCFLVGVWLLLHHQNRLRAMVIPAAVFAASLVLNGWDWPLRWVNGPSIANLVGAAHNITPWRSLEMSMAPVAVTLGLWALRLPRTRQSLGAMVAANALATPYMGSYALVHVLTFSLLPLGPNWALVGWLASFTVFLRPWSKEAVGLDFLIAAVLMVGYLLHAKRSVRPTPRGSTQ